MANHLRTVNVIDFVAAPEYEKYLDLVECEERNIVTREGDSRIIIITPKEVKQRYPLFIHMHGGGFVRGYIKRDTIFCSMIASKAGCKVIDIDYRLAPEYPFPAGLNECYDIVKWAFENAEELNVDKENIVVGGDSAGGNFTAAIALMANQSKDFKMKLQILDYPFLDAVTDPADKIKEAGILPVERLRAFNALYLGIGEDKYNPFLSPVCAKKEMLYGLPPALVITAGKDCLRYEADKYAMMMVEAGVEVKLKRFLNSNHGFTVNCNGEFVEAQNMIVDTLRETFNAK
jgi:acetyl esterase